MRYLYCFHLILVYLVTVISTGELSIHFLYLDTKGELWNGGPCSSASQCNPGLTICISLEETDTAFDCNTKGTVEPIIRTRIYTGVNNISFGNSLGEVSNPVILKTDTFEGIVDIFIEVNNYNYPNASFESIDRIYIHINTSLHATNNVLEYKGSRPVNPTITGITYKYSDELTANQIGIANGGMGILQNTMQMVLLAILLGIGVILILSVCCCLLIINRVKSRERIIVDSIPDYPRRRKQRRNSQTGLLTNKEDVNKYNTFNEETESIKK